LIKGRGNFRYRTPSRSRSRSFTPEHWKAAQRNVIKLTDFERLEEQKKVREAEVTRRAEERKKRHEALSKGDGKKSFFELAQDVPEPTILTVASSLTRPEKSGSVDLNALDYEESDSEKETRENFRKLEEKSDKNGKSTSITRTRRNRSRSRSRGSVKRSRSRDRFDRERRDFRPPVRNRFNDNRRWDNNRAVGRNRFDNNNRWRRSKDRKSRSRSNSRSRSRNRSYRRRSSSAPRNQSKVQRIPTPIKLSKAIDRKSPNGVETQTQPPRKKNEDADDIAELERRVLEAKKVLEVMVKEKMKEKSRSSSSEGEKRGKKRSRRPRHNSRSD